MEVKLKINFFFYNNSLKCMYKYKIKYFVYETYTNYRCLYLRFKFCIYVFVLHALFMEANNYFINSKQYFKNLFKRFSF